MLLLEMCMKIFDLPVPRRKVILGAGPSPLAKSDAS